MLERELLEFRCDASAIIPEWVVTFEWFELSRIQCGVEYPDLRKFFGELAAVFPGTAVVESDFSVSNHESHAHRRALRILSIAEIVHSKQWYVVRAFKFS